VRLFLGKIIMDNKRYLWKLCSEGFENRKKYFVTEERTYQVD